MALCVWLAAVLTALVHHDYAKALQLMQRTRQGLDVLWSTSQQGGTPGLAR